MKLAQDFRQDAKKALKGHWFVAIISAFIASLLGGLNGGSASFSSSSSGSDSGTSSDSAVWEEIFAGVDPEVLTLILTVIGVFAIVVGIFALITVLIGGAVGVGYSRFNLNLVDNKKARIGDLFSAFSEWKTAFIARILVGLYTFLWTLLFFIPGIIAAYSYSMVHFVMAEHPEMSANEAIKESKMLMKGNKFRFFCLQLSFIGWYFVGILTLGIGFIWIIPYQQAAYAAFFREICPASVETKGDYILD